MKRLIPLLFLLPACAPHVRTYDVAGHKLTIVQDNTLEQSIAVVQYGDSVRVFSSPGLGASLLGAAGHAAAAHLRKPDRVQVSNGSSSDSDSSNTNSNQANAVGTANPNRGGRVTVGGN